MTNQKAGLTLSLLSIGALNKARPILLVYPKLPLMYPDIAESMCRLLDVIIEPVYSPLRSFPLTSKKNLEDYPPAIPTLNTKLCRDEARVILGKKVNPPKLQFFYDKWKEGLPLCTDFTSCVKTLRMLLAHVGPHLCRDVKLVWKIIRIGIAHLKQVSFYFLFQIF